MLMKSARLFFYSRNKCVNLPDRILSGNNPVNLYDHSLSEVNSVNLSDKFCRKRTFSVCPIESCSLSKSGIEDPLTDTDGLGGNLQKFIILYKFKGLLK